MPRRRAIAALGLAFAAGLVGCGDDGGPTEVAGSALAVSTVRPASDTSSTTARATTAPAASAPPPPTTLVGGITAKIRVGTDPGYGTAAFGLVWVANHHGDSVMAINPATNKVVRTFEVAGEPVGLAEGYGSLWTFSPVDEVVRRIDPGDGTIVDIRVDAFDAPLDGMRAAAGSMWFANERGELIEIDPATNEVIETYAVADGGCPASLAVVDTHLWYLPQCGSSTLTEVDAETGSVVRTVSVPADSVGLDAGLGAIWVVGMAGELTKVDPETATVVATASIGSAGDRVRVGTKAVFVRLDAVRLVRVDPESLEVEAKYDRFPSAQIPGGGLVVTDDDVWVINFAAGNVMRIPADG